MGIKTAVIASAKNAKPAGIIIVGYNAFSKIQSPGDSCHMQDPVDE